MAKINSINNKSGSLEIDPGASGDSYVQFSINTTGEFLIGVDDDDGDSFKISQGSALGSNDTFVVAASGEITKPLQPAFLAYNSTTDSNVTGNSTEWSCDFDTEVFDKNADFASDTFIAPVTGVYRFCCSVILGGITSADIAYVKIITSNRNYGSRILDPSACKASSGYVGLSFSCLADLDASDTAYVTITSGGEGSDINDVYGTSAPETFFAGYLVC